MVRSPFRYATISKSIRSLIHMLRTHVQSMEQHREWNCVCVLYGKECVMTFTNCVYMLRATSLVCLRHRQQRKNGEKSIREFSQQCYVDIHSNTLTLKHAHTHTHSHASHPNQERYLSESKYLYIETLCIPDYARLTVAFHHPYNSNTHSHWQRTDAGFI